jgi:polyphenol oxidase
MWLKAPNITCVHGFSSREGGVSPAPFDKLNLGGSEDLESNITENRKIALKTLGLSAEQLCSLKQVHGNRVCTASPGKKEGDALVTNVPGQVLVVSVADCYPILFHDPVKNVIGAAHAGWRGTRSLIAAEVVTEMRKLGSQPDNIQVAIGQGISLKNFQVGAEVIAEFRSAGFPEDCWNNDKVDLAACNRFVLEKENIPASNIWTMNRCTFEPQFFSYRRDKGVTGRMWGLISMQ